MATFLQFVCSEPTTLLTVVLDPTSYYYRGATADVTAGQSSSVSEPIAYSSQ